MFSLSFVCPLGYPHVALSGKALHQGSHESSINDVGLHVTSQSPPQIINQQNI